MAYRIGAELVVLLHFAFVVFVVLGGLIAAWWPRAALVHVPAALWGAATALFGIVCPLTPLEQRLRRLAGDTGYEGGFIEHYLLPILYPGELTRALQIGLGAAAILVNAAIYAWVITRSRARSLRVP